MLSYFKALKEKRQFIKRLTDYVQEAQKEEFYGYAYLPFAKKIFSFF